MKFRVKYLNECLPIATPRRHGATPRDAARTSSETENFLRSYWLFLCSLIGTFSANHFGFQNCLFEDSSLPLRRDVALLIVADVDGGRIRFGGRTSIARIKIANYSSGI